MLVLGRKVGERVCIGGDVYVTVVSVGGSRVRLGFEAPREISIRREELPPRPDRSAEEGERRTADASP
ncbi:MAG: carbon storage regulator [Planctomycetales bacterium]